MFSTLLYSVTGVIKQERVPSVTFERKKCDGCRQWFPQWLDRFGGKSGWMMCVVPLFSSKVSNLNGLEVTRISPHAKQRLHQQIHT